MSLTELTYCQDYKTGSVKWNNLLTQILDCDTSWEVSEEGTIGVQNESPQDVPL